MALETGRTCVERLRRSWSFLSRGETQPAFRLRASVPVAGGLEWSWLFHRRDKATPGAILPFRLSGRSPLGLAEGVYQGGATCPLYEAVLAGEPAGP